jgi:hypothetical protein
MPFHNKRLNNVLNSLYLGTQVLTYLDVPVKILRNIFIMSYL